MSVLTVSGNYPESFTEISGLACIMVRGDYIYENWCFDIN